MDFYRVEYLISTSRSAAFAPKQQVTPGKVKTAADSVRAPSSSEARERVHVQAFLWDRSFLGLIFSAEKVCICSSALRDPRS